ncbi:replication protein A [Rhizobium sp. RU36D]|uniref:replication protein A n=1 Tax=Rhizobium sp. RU36D TaxID=1907415 RepID=UPI0009D8A436|nr:replication protein A [Rhizobium sp. RU36D]SMD20343.1 hypothetical protein SAMN05880593_1539 [Rhizobium sp. RU36D]
MFKQIGAALAFAPAKGRRARNPVHRNSRLAGRCEGTFWRRTTRQDARRIVLAARRYEIANKQKGCRNGPLGMVGIEVLELLTNLVDFKTGRLEPSIDTIMSKLCRSRDAVVRALKALRTHGFLDWIRRYVPTEAEGERGPQVRQVTNAYRLSLPARALAFLGRYGARPAPSDDLLQAEDERKVELAEFEKQSMVTSDQLGLFADSDNPVLRSLARMRSKMLLLRESADRTETRSDSNTKKE